MPQPQPQPKPNRTDRAGYEFPAIMQTDGDRATMMQRFNDARDAQQAGGYVPPLEARLRRLAGALWAAAFVVLAMAVLMLATGVR